jgi:uncharacterized Zn-finger protein
MDKEESLGVKLEGLNPSFLELNIMGYGGDKNRLTFKIIIREKPLFVECQIEEIENDHYNVYIIIKDYETQYIKLFYDQTGVACEEEALICICFKLNEHFSVI